MAAKMAMMAMTTNNSISVNPFAFALTEWLVVLLVSRMLFHFTFTAYLREGYWLKALGCRLSAFVIPAFAFAAIDLTKL